MGFSENFCQVSSLYKGWTFRLLMGGVGDLVQAGILFNPFMHQGICSQGCLIFFVLRVTHAFFGSLVVGMNLFLVQECMRDIFQNHPRPLPSKVNWSTPKGLGNGAILSSLRVSWRGCHATRPLESQLCDNVKMRVTQHTGKKITSKYKRLRGN